MARRARMAKWRRHSVEFKRQVVERMKICELADKALENDFFESALLRIKEVRQQSLSSGASASTTSSSRGRKSKAR